MPVSALGYIYFDLERWARPAPAVEPLIPCERCEIVAADTETRHCASCWDAQDCAECGEHGAHPETLLCWNCQHLLDLDALAYEDL